jgi:hypothetical protein
MSDGPASGRLRVCAQARAARPGAKRQGKVGARAGRSGRFAAGLEDVQKLFTGEVGNKVSYSA